MNKSYDMGMNTFTSGFSGACKYSLLSIIPLIDSVTSGTGSAPKRNRCSDRFVKYPYPKNLISNYQKEYPSKHGTTHMISKEDAFNIEKEHKIINPHKMELSTTNKVAFQAFQVKPS